jgi:ribosomal protein S26
MPEKPLMMHMRRAIQCDHCGKTVPAKLAVKMKNETGSFPVCPTCVPVHLATGTIHAE